jgi:hypothetical protein
MFNSSPNQLPEEFTEVLGNPETQQTDFYSQNAGEEITKMCLSVLILIIGIYGIVYSITGCCTEWCALEDNTRSIPRAADSQRTDYTIAEGISI